MDPSCRASTPDHSQPQLFWIFFKIFGESNMSPNRVWGSWVSCQTLWIQVVEHRPLIILSTNCFGTFPPRFWWIGHVADRDRTVKQLFLGCVPPTGENALVTFARTEFGPSLWELSFLSNIMDPSWRESTPDHSQHQLFFWLFEVFLWTWHVADPDLHYIVVCVCVAVLEKNHSGPTAKAWL